MTKHPDLVPDAFSFEHFPDVEIGRMCYIIGRT